VKPRWDAQIHDHRFPVFDSDAGAIERNQQYNAIALQRAAARNGGEHVPASAPQSVVSADMTPSMAVDKPVRKITDEGAGGPDMQGFTAKKTKEAEKEGVVKSADETLSWGRGGEVEASVGWNDVPQPNAATGISSAASERLTASAPSTFGRPGQPVANHSEGNWNMEAIARGTRIGG
jgi:hypothetical protein